MQEKHYKKRPPEVSTPTGSGPRTNRLLLHMQLQADRQDKPLAYAKDIRA